MASKTLPNCSFEKRTLLLKFKQQLPKGLQDKQAKNEEKVRDRLQIHFQRRRVGGGDIERVLYPLSGHPNNAIIVFNDSTDSKPDMTRLLSSDHTIDLVKGSTVDVSTETLPEMFQEVQLVVNQFYWPLLPHGNELEDILRTNTSGSLKNSIITIPNTEDIETVRNAVAKVVGIPVGQNTETQNSEERKFENHLGQNQATDSSVRPKESVSKTVSDHNDRWSRDRNAFKDQDDVSKETASTSQVDLQGDEKGNGNASLGARPKSTRVIQKSSPRRMAAKLGGGEDESEKAETAADNDMEYETHSGIENKDDTENMVENDDARAGEDSCRGPFSVSTLLLKYLEEKHKQAMTKIRQKYKVVIECVVDKSQGGQGKVFIKRNEKMEKCSEAEMDEAEDEFVSLYQERFQNVTISKPFPCHGIDTQRVNNAISYIWTQQKSVLVEDSIDGEVTFIGLEKEVSEAIRAFQHTTGLHPKTRKLKHSSESSHSSMSTSPFSSSTPQSSSTPRIRYDSSGGSSSGYAGVGVASQFSGQGRRFKTDEGIDVVAKQDDITKQKVDIIVNPSNDELSLGGGGVGGALLQAAGRRLQDECDDKRRKLTKKLSEADCVSTKGYGLPSQYVVHVIGPQYPRSTNDRAISGFYSKLQETFLNCFTEANNLHARSIAIPLVSSGAFGGPKEGCAKALIDALKKYSRMGRNNTINSVYLVNNDVEAYEAILKALNGLDETGSGSEEPMDTDDGMETSQNKQSFWKETLPAGYNMSALGTTEMNLQTGGQNMNAAGSLDDSGMKLKATYNVDNVQITVQQQTILESVKQADGIIVPANSMLDNEIATTIRLEGGINEELMRKTNGFRLSDGEVLHVSGNKFGNAKIIFINVPEEKYFSNNRRGLFDKFTDAAYNGLKYADASLRLKEVALLCVPTEGNGPELYCEGLAKAVRRFTDFGVRNIEHVHVVSDNNELNMVLQVTFDDEFKDTEESGSGIGGAHAIVRRDKGVNRTHTHFDSNNYEESMRHERANSRHSEADDIDTSGKEDRPQDDGKDDDSDEEDKRCPICLEDFGDDTPAVNLGKCKHKFCQECLNEFMKRKPMCPVCGVVYGAMKGNQPPGQMSVNESSYGRGLPGYEGCGIITIHYSFSGGTQGPDHPEPGNYYTGTSRTAYLPNNAEGKKVLALLRRAFDAKLTFTIGTSVTSGVRNIVTWNDIHHKTNQYGGQQGFGYPDPTYLSRVTEELAAKGIK